MQLFLKDSRPGLKDQDRPVERLYPQQGRINKWAQNCKTSLTVNKLCYWPCQTSTLEPTFLADTWTNSSPWRSLQVRRQQICNSSLFTTSRQGRNLSKSFSLNIFRCPKSSTFFKHSKESQSMSGKVIDLETHDMGRHHTSWRLWNQAY